MSLQPTAAGLSSSTSTSLERVKRKLEEETNNESSSSTTTLVSASASPIFGSATSHPSSIGSLNTAGKQLKSTVSAQVGASLLGKDFKGFSPLENAIRCNDLKTLKALTETTSHTAFASCKDIHDFFAVLFPPYRDRFPPKWKQFAEKTPKSAELVEFEKRVISKYQKEAAAMEKESSIPQAGVKDQADAKPKKKIPSEKELDDLLLANPSKNSLEVLAESLLETSSFCFRQAWELANHPQKVSLQELPKEAFTREGKQMFIKGQEAVYVPNTHSILINKEATWKNKKESLLFETFNSLQRSTIQDLASRCPGREEFAFCVEWIETNTEIWRMFFHGNVNLTRSFQEKEDMWKQSNTPVKSEEEFISHTENLRYMWDTTHATQYLEKNPTFLKQRLAELEKGSSAIEQDDFKVQGTGL